jgi:glycosyltransferase involved in cell wall biosynthesis
MKAKIVALTGKVRKMKVLMLSGIMYGGAWRRNYNVLKVMRKVDRRIDYTLLLDTSLIKLVPNGEEVIGELKKRHQLRLMKTPLRTLRVTPLHYIYMNKLSKMMKDVAKEEKADLIFVANEVDWWILSAKNASDKALPWTALFQSMPLFGCIPKINSKGTLSTLMEAPPISLKPHKRLRGVYRFARLHLLIKALEETLSLSVSESISRDLRTFFSSLRIRTLRPGVGIELSYIRSIPPKPKDFDAIYFTSELIPHKGFLDLPRIWKDVTISMPKARLLVVGKGQPMYLKAFSDLVKKLDLGSNITLSGLLPHEEIISLVKSAKVMVYPSVYDAFPLVVLEALASGVPVVAYDVPFIGLNYKIQSVIKCPVNDTKCLATRIVELLSNNGLRKNLSREAVKYAARFSWETVAKEEAEAYSKVLDFWSNK